MKTKFSRRILAFVLMLSLVVPMFVFNASAEGEKTVTFNMGNDGTATHADGSSSASYNQTVDGYKLAISGGTNMYTGARDAKGNGCIKFGTSSKAGSCTITVPEDVQSIVIHVAAYKAKTATVTINGKATTLTKKSDNGEYDAITVDTSSTKTVSFSVTSGYRAMLNAIDFIVADNGTPSLSITGNDIVAVGSTTTLTAKLSNITGDVAWTSSNPEVATVNGGVVTGIAMGTTTITATVGELSETYDVTVFPAAGQITIAEALEIAKLAGSSNSPYKYTIIGTITEIKEYSSQYDNVTLYISDDTGSIYVYRMNGGAELQVGHNIAVSGNLMTYGTTQQVAQYAEYELILDTSTEAIIEALNALEAKMSLAYKYETSVESVVLPNVSETADALNREFTGISKGTTYGSWSGKTGTSGAVYAGNSAGDSDTIQMRTNNSNSGVVSTTSGGRVKSITITWNTKTTTNRVLNVYGSNTAYTQATDLYDSAKQGTKVTSFTYDGSTTTATYTFEDDYAYIGIRSDSGALYLDSVSIVWEQNNGDNAGETVEKEIYKNSEFAFRFAVDASLVDIEGVESYGIKVSAGGKEVLYSTDAISWTVEGGYAFVTVELGDIINNKSKLSTKFTVAAYVEVDGIVYVSETTKTYSVADMVAHYVDTLGIEEITHLYDFISNEHGLI